LIAVGKKLHGLTTNKNILIPVHENIVYTNGRGLEDKNY
jgi:hypothetical protein